MRFLFFILKFNLILASFVFCLRSFSNRYNLSSVENADQKSPVNLQPLFCSLFLIKVPAMAEERAVFDCEAAERVVAEVRECYNSGKTRRYEWRVEQVKNLLKLVDENQKEMIDTVHSDFSKPEFEAFAHEVRPPFLFFIYLFYYYYY